MPNKSLLLCVACDLGCLALFVHDSGILPARSCLIFSSLCWSVVDCMRLSSRLTLVNEYRFGVAITDSS